MLSATMPPSPSKMHARRANPAADITDDCTGLFNARHLYERLEHSLERSQRSGKPVSLIFFDLDHFKLVNDTYGHLNGSRSAEPKWAIWSVTVWGLIETGTDTAAMNLSS